MQIEKYGTTASSGKYIPLVLRLSKNALVTVSAPVSSSQESSSVSTSDSDSLSQSQSVTDNTGSTAASNDNVPTGDNSNAFYLVIFLLTMVSGAIVLTRKKQGLVK